MTAPWDSRSLRPSLGSRRNRSPNRKCTRKRSLGADLRKDLSRRNPKAITSMPRRDRRLRPDRNRSRPRRNRSKLLHNRSKLLRNRSNRPSHRSNLRPSSDRPLRNRPLRPNLRTTSRPPLRRRLSSRIPPTTLSTRSSPFKPTFSNSSQKLRTLRARKMTNSIYTLTRCSRGIS